MYMQKEDQRRIPLLIFFRLVFNILNLIYIYFQKNEIHKKILSERIQAIQKLSQDDPFIFPSAGHSDLSAFIPKLLVPKPRLQCH